MEIIKIFESAENRQYYIDDSGLFWIHGTLLAKRLGFKNTSEAIMMHTDPDEREQPDALSAMPSPPWFVSEYGIWSMILASKSPEAKEFKRKLKREILPSIRKQGGYIDPKATNEQIANLLKPVVDRLPSNERLQSALALLLEGNAAAAVDESHLAKMVDSAQLERLERAVNALKSMQDNPGKAGYYARYWGKALNLPQ